jgi:hypothetical protein
MENSLHQNIAYKTKNVNAGKGTSSSYPLGSFF